MMKIKPIGLVVTVLFALVLVVGSCGQQKVGQGNVTGLNTGNGDGLSDAQIDEMWTDIVPETGTATAYGIPLSLENTQQFIDWFNGIELSKDEQELKTAALSSLVAPCCDDYPVSEC